MTISAPESEPTVVAVYELVAAEFERVAEFRLTDSGTVELTVNEPDGCPLAQNWFANGVRVPGRAEPVAPEAGHAFLAAVLQPRRMSYCRVVDESPRVAPEAADRPATASPNTANEH